MSIRWVIVVLKQEWKGLATEALCCICIAEIFLHGQFYGVRELLNQHALPDHKGVLESDDPYR